jgi:hypothetical protein
MSEQVEMGSSVVAAGAEGSKLPEKKFKAGSITATIWKGTSEKGPYYTVQLGKSYKDKLNGNWKTTSSLREHEVPKAMVLLQKAYEYVIVQQTNGSLA